jgi:hypothetical protein
MGRPALFRVFKVKIAVFARKISPQAGPSAGKGQRAKVDG